MFQAKIKIVKVVRSEHSDRIEGEPVTDDGPENKTFAKATPAGSIGLTITNPDLIGKINPGDVFIVDFFKVEKLED